MTEIELAEFSSREAAKFSLQGLADSRGRAHALLLVLLGGGGALGALALAQWGAQPILGIAAAAASVWWFAGAAWVACRALTSDPVRSWAPAGMLVHHAEWAKFKAELHAEGKADEAASVDPVAECRRAAIAAADTARDGYRVASTHAYVTLDQVYRAMSATPVVSALAVAVYHRLG